MLEDLDEREEAIDQVRTSKLNKPDKKRLIAVFNLRNRESHQIVEYLR